MNKSKRIIRDGTPNVQAVPDKVTIKEALAFLAGHGFGTAPVVNESGKPVGVLSTAEMARYQPQKEERARAAPAPVHDKLDAEADDDSAVWDTMGRVVLAADSWDPFTQSSSPFFR